MWREGAGWGFTKEAFAFGGAGVRGPMYNIASIVRVTKRQTDPHLIVRIVLIVSFSLLFDVVAPFGQWSPVINRSLFVVAASDQ